MLAIGSIAGMAVGSRAQAETQYTPSVDLAQRYDSNVYNTAKQFVPGKQSWDLVTTLGAKVEILNKSRLGDTAVSVGVDGNAYAYNSDLMYAATNVLASSDVSDWAQELLPGLKLRISDAFRYSPQQPTFTYSSGTPQPGGATQQTGVFSRGIQGARSNAYTNNLSTDAGYSFSRTVGLRAYYSYSILHIGRQFVTPAGTSTAFNFYDTTVHNVAIGPTFTLDGGDTLFLKFNYLSGDQSNTAGTSPRIKFTSQSIEPEYVAKIVRDWTATISGGATVIEQGGNRAFASGTFSLTNAFDRQTRVSIEFSRQTAPAFIGSGGAVISNVAQLYVSHGFSRVVWLTVRGGYANNESAQGQVYSNKTIIGSAVLDYNLTRSTTLSLSQEYNHFNISGVPSFDRLVTMLAVRTKW
jgi:hypothetical protein